jgi:hypothetical protein
MNGRSCRARALRVKFAVAGAGGGLVSRGADWLDYFQNEPLPTFHCTVGQTAADYDAACVRYTAGLEAHIKTGHDRSVHNTDCSGTPGPMCNC